MFQKGVSGNPGGKKKKTEQQVLFESRCREYMNVKGIEKLKAMIEGEDQGNVRFALEKMMSYGWGKPTENLDVTTYDGADERQDGDIAGEIEAVIAGAKGAIGVQPVDPEAPPNQ